SVMPCQKASIVVASWSSTSAARTQHDLTVLPASSTVHAPQLPVAQPMCTPVSWRCSRRSSVKIVLLSSFSTRSRPFTFTETVVRVSAALATLPLMSSPPFLVARQGHADGQLGIHPRHLAAVLARPHQISVALRTALVR